jgi:hypothetical protein
MVKKILFLGALAWAINAVMCGSRDAKRRRHTEGLLQDGLEGTYPASDPVSSQNFDIPANRQGPAT